MYSESRVSFDIARKLPAADPMAVMLRALIAKIMSVRDEQTSSTHLRELIFNATQQAFVVGQTATVTRTSTTAQPSGSRWSMSSSTGT